ncbi:unnamed protein product [Urochloa humidicola]
MENVLLDRSSGSLEFPKRSLGRSWRGLQPYSHLPPGSPYSSYPMLQPYGHLHEGGAYWASAPALPYARPPIYSSPSLPLLPSNQPPLLPLPPTATKYATFPCLPAAPQPPPPPPAATRRGGAAITTGIQAAPPARRERDRRRRPSRPPPSTAAEAPRERRKKPLDRATPLPPPPVVNEALDDLEQEVARNFVQDLLHVLAPPPSSLPLPRFSLVMNKASPATAAPSCNVEAAAADGIHGLLRL